MEKEKRVFCSQCGSKLPIEQSELSIAATFVSNDIAGCDMCSRIVVHELPGKRKKSVHSRFEVLRDAGVDTTSLYALRGAKGAKYVLCDDDLAILDKGHPIFHTIIEQGTIPNNLLYRRFVMAQMFHMMTHPESVTEAIHDLGYEYQWKMLLNELYAQMKMEEKGCMDLPDRNRWFNARVVEAMAEHDIKQLIIYVNKPPFKRCKGKPYKRIKGDDMFFADMQDKLFGPLQAARSRITRTHSAAQLYHAAKKYNDMRVKMKQETPQCKAWVDAYKGAGAFFTMQNLIRFHNCFAIDDADNYLNKIDSLVFVTMKAEQYKNGNGWRLLAVLKKMLEDNNINVKKKIAEWNKKKR